MRPGSPAVVLAGAALCIVAALWLGGRGLSEPGLYYDEVIQAGPALSYLRGEDVPLRVPGARAVRVPGGWLPWMTQPYMGALKGQLLIPLFASIDASAETLRATTLVWALLGIPLIMLFANRLAGLPVALVGGALLAVDPSLLFIARHDWGSFSLGFLLRCAGLWCVYAGFRGGSVAAVASGGLCLGLGLYNKIDFGVFLVGCVAALALTMPGRLLHALRAQTRQVVALFAGLVAGTLPLLLALGGALSVAGAATRSGSLASEWAEKWIALRSVLDGSYFLRLMQSGGRFEDLGVAAGAGPALGFAVFSLAALVIALVQVHPRLREPRDRVSPFILLTALLTLIGIALVPHALRAHHFLNALPFPQLAVASAALLLWTRVSRIARIPARAAAVLLVAAALGSALRLDVLTLRSVEQTGGHGRWSHAVEDWARTLPPDLRVVSLDWGFDGPIRFVAPGTPTEEPIWKLRRGGAAARIEGGPNDLYLVHEPRYAVMPYGGALLALLDGLPPDAAEVRVHLDRTGEPVFRSIRFSRPHVLVYRGGRFEVSWQ